MLIEKIIPQFLISFQLYANWSNWPTPTRVNEIITYQTGIEFVSILGRDRFIWQWRFKTYYTISFLYTRNIR